MDDQMGLNSIDLRKLRIRHYPDPVLRRVAQPVTEIGPELAALAERMIDLMVEADGVGLAAPQVGVPLRLIVVSLTGSRDDAEVLVNPELSDLQGVAEVEEGCLSVPGIHAKVRRATACTVHAQSLERECFVLEAVDLAARAVQHETDHLDGKLFIDRLGTVGKMACRKAVKQLEREFADE